MFEPLKGFFTNKFISINSFKGQNVSSGVNKELIASYSKTINLKIFFIILIFLSLIFTNFAIKILNLSFYMKKI
jgi:hypothetical protein